MALTKFTTNIKHKNFSTKIANTNTYSYFFNSPVHVLQNIKKTS